MFYNFPLHGPVADWPQTENASPKYTQLRKDNIALALARTTEEKKTKHTTILKNLKPTVTTLKLPVSQNVHTDGV